MGIKEYFEKRKLLKKERLRKKILGQEEKKKEQEPKTRCKNCGNPYMYELVGPSDIYHARGFCSKMCEDVYKLKKIKELSERLSKVEKRLNKVVKIIYYKVLKKR